MREVTCPRCGQPTYGAEEGLQTQCQQCAGVFVAPPVAAEAAAAPASPGATAAAPIVDFANVRVSDADEPAGPEMWSPCPICGAENRRNAKSCSACGEVFNQQAPTGPPEAATVRSVLRVFGDAWAIYRRRFGLIMAGWVVAATVSALFFVLIAGIVPRYATGAWDDWWPVLGPFLQVVCVLYWQLGLSRLTLNVCRDDSPEFSDVLLGVYRLIHVVAATIGVWSMYGMVMAMALVVVVAIGGATSEVKVVVGGFYLVTCPLVFATQLGVGFGLMDRRLNLGGYWSVRLTIYMINENVVGLYVLSLCCAGALIAANLALVFPLIFVVPYLSIVFAVAYLNASGQSAAIAVPVPRVRQSQAAVEFPADLE